jgi:hypothetical protein
MENKLWHVKVRKHDSYTFDGRTYKTHDKGTLLASCYVYAPNKRFARWNSERETGFVASYSLLYPDSVIVRHVGLVRKGK